MIKEFILGSAVAGVICVSGLFQGCTRDDNPARPGNGDNDTLPADTTLSTAIILSDSMKANHYVPDFYMHYDYIDTIRTSATGDRFYFTDSTKGMSLSFDSTKAYCLVRWTYDSGTVNGGTKYDDIPGGVLHASVVAVRGQARDTITWTVKVNTQPWIETSQYQMRTRVYVGNATMDTIKVSDVDGDRPGFTITDSAGLGLAITGALQVGDTTWSYLSLPVVTKTGTFPVSINVIDSLYGYDTSLVLTYRSAVKTLITSGAGFMKYGTPVDSEYRDTLGIFEEYRAGAAAVLLRGPTGMALLEDSIITWMPSVAAEETVAVRMTHPGYEKGADTLVWVVRAVALSKYVFWYNASQYGNTLHDNPGPNLPSDISLFEGTTACFVTRLMDKSPGWGLLVAGNGSALPWGRSSMAYFRDLCDMQGTAVRAVVRAEFRDGWGAYPGKAFVEPGEFTVKIGIIDLTVYRELAAPIGYGGAIACSSVYKGGYPPCNNGWDYDMKFYYHPQTKVTIPGLMAEKTVTLTAPAGRPAEDEPSALDKQFYDIDVTEQVQWILNRKGKDYVTPSLAGDYAIVFLVPPDFTAGGVGVINCYAYACGGNASGSDSPWTTDGNTLHLYLEGDISPVQ